jgi:hypothetical protein
MTGDESLLALIDNELDEATRGGLLDALSGSPLPRADCPFIGPIFKARSGSILLKNPGISLSSKIGFAAAFAWIDMK